MNSEKSPLLNAKPPQAGLVLMTTPGQLHTRETEGLVQALGVETMFTQKLTLRKPHPATLVSSGQIHRLKEKCSNSTPELLILDTSLTPVQQRNLEKILHTKILDRTGLILEIFGLRAQSAEGRLQVQMAHFLYERSRLVRSWTHLERQRGKLGFVGGPGERQIESDRRLLDKRLDRCRNKLEQIRRNRRLQKQGRNKRGLPVVALIGYTNAGKSTLFNTLSGAKAMVANMPFATLDPCIREINLPSRRKCALIDTVGFVGNLPTCLIAAFRATIEQLLEADLLLHVRDMAHPETLAQQNDVQQVLQQLASDARQSLPPLIEVRNKIDAIKNTDPDNWTNNPEIIPVSALTGKGQTTLLKAMERSLYPEQHLLQIELEPDEGNIRAWLHRVAQVLHEECTDNGAMRLEVLATPEEISRIQALSPEALPI